MKMRWKFVCSILLVYCIAVSIENERPKRDLLKLKKFIASKLLKRKNTAQSNYKVFRIAGFNNIMVKAVPKMHKIVHIPDTILEDKTRNDTLKALEDIKNLLKLEILNDKNDKIIQEIIVPMFETPSVKFTTTDVTETYSMKDINSPGAIIIRNPPIQVTEVDALVPDDTKYSYKQISKDKETTTFVSQNSPNTVITTTKNIPRLPPFIKTRIKEVASMGFHPYAFGTPGAVIPARPPVLVEEIVRIPTVTQGVTFLRKPGVIGIYDSPVMIKAAKPPILLKETVKMPALSPYISERNGMLPSPTVPLRSAILPLNSVVDFYNPTVVSERRPIMVKETMKIPISGLRTLNNADEIGIYRRSPFMSEQRPPVLVKETVGVPAFVPLAKRSPVLVKETSHFPLPAPEVVNDFHQPLMGVIRPLVKETAEVPGFPSEIPPSLIYTLPPLVMEDQSNSKNSSGFLYTFTNTNEMNNSKNNINSIQPKISTNRSNADSRISKGTEKGMTHLREIPPPPTLGDFNNSKGFSYHFVSTNKVYNGLTKNMTNLIEKEIHTNNKGILMHNQINTPSFSSERNYSNKELNFSLVNNSKYSESVNHRGDIPSSPSLLSHENEENSEELELNNSKSISLSHVTSTQTTSLQSSKMDDKLVNVLSSVIPLNSGSSNTSKSEGAYTKHGTLNTSSDNLEVLLIKTKENVSGSLSPSPQSNKYNENMISSKNVSNTFNSKNSRSVQTVDTTSNAKNSSYRRKQENILPTQNNKNQTEQYILSLDTLKSNKIDSTSNHNMDLKLNSTQLNTSVNKSYDAQKTTMNEVTQLKLSVNGNNTEEINNTKPVLEKQIDKELNTLRKNKYPTKAFIEAQAELIQIENRILQASDTQNASINSSDNVNLIKEEDLTSNLNTYFGLKRNSSFTNTRNEKFSSKVTKINKINSIFGSNNTRISNITAIPQVFNNRKVGGDKIGNRQKPPISLSLKKGNNQKQNDKYALNPSRKAAIKRLMGRNETTSNNFKNVTKTVLSSKKQTSQTSSNNHAVNMNRKVMIDKRPKRDVNKVSHKIPNHYLYVPPLDVYVPPPIRPIEFDKVQKGSFSIDEALSQFEKNYKHVNLDKNRLIALNSNNHHVFLNNNTTDSNTFKDSLVYKL